MVQIRCGHCKKLVELPAKICPHCNQDLAALPSSGSPDFSRPLGRPDRAGSKGRLRLPIWSLVIAGLVILSVIVVLAPMILKKEAVEEKSSPPNPSPRLPDFSVYQRPRSSVNQLNRNVSTHNSDLEETLEEE